MTPSPRSRRWLPVALLAVLVGLGLTGMAARTNGAVPPRSLRSFSEANAATTASQPRGAVPDSAPAIVVRGSASGAPACASCHGVTGAGLAAGAFPRLAGQDYRYLAKQLDDYRDGSRRNAVMEPIARALTASEILEVSRWYAAATPPATDWGVTVDSATIAYGRRLALRGDWPRGVPACSSCHGLSGGGVPPYFPAIRGQSPDYVEAQLVAWRDGSRMNDSLRLMHPVASGTPPGAGAAVAHYYSMQMTANRNAVKRGSAP